MNIVGERSTPRVIETAGHPDLQGSGSLPEPRDRSSDGAWKIDRQD
ncbi:hypothetical protein [Brevundimonas sp.]|jgi:hypothetical protein